MNEEQIVIPKTRLEEVEAELLHRIDELESGAGKTWLQRNMATVISTTVIIITLGIAWGRMETTISALQHTDSRLEQELDKEAVAVRIHHEDVSRHVDQIWKSEIRADVAAIRELLIEHMSDGKRSAKRE